VTNIIEGNVFVKTFLVQVTLQLCSDITVKPNLYLTGQFMGSSVLGWQPSGNVLHSSSELLQ